MYVIRYRSGSGTAAMWWAAGCIDGARETMAEHGISEMGRGRPYFVLRAVEYN